MPRQAKELSAISVSRLSFEGLHFVGGVSGLALQVLPSGARTWVLRMMVGGKLERFNLTDAMRPHSKRLFVFVQTSIFFQSHRATYFQFLNGGAPCYKTPRYNQK